MGCASAPGCGYQQGTGTLVFAKWGSPLASYLLAFVTDLEVFIEK